MCTKPFVFPSNRTSNSKFLRSFLPLTNPWQHPLNKSPLNSALGNASLPYPLLQHPIPIDSSTFFSILKLFQKLHPFNDRSQPPLLITLSTTILFYSLCKKGLPIHTLGEITNFQIFIHPTSKFTDTDVGRKRNHPPTIRLRIDLDTRLEEEPFFHFFSIDDPSPLRIQRSIDTGAFRPPVNIWIGRVSAQKEAKRARGGPGFRAECSYYSTLARHARLAARLPAMLKPAYGH